MNRLWAWLTPIRPIADIDGRPHITRAAFVEGLARQANDIHVYIPG